ncbi:MAG TPA: Nif3-like dinuclear metal center hexameric protein [Flavobacteriaceae bacterium]|nr:Nif3-like dinuclear metal center hexameric protein [Flavobacteriaceae bacterium]
MYVQDVMDILDEFAPLSYAEGFDNTGLLVGDAHQKVTGILVTLDTLEEVVDEAIAKNCNLIVSFHPIIFSGLKSITGKTYVERVVLKAIRNNISIYAIHTALDNNWQGVNHGILNRLGLKKIKTLIPQKETIEKLVAFVPKEHADKVREAMFAAGAGNIGNYSNCSFNLEGVGTFMPGEDSNPTSGTIGQLHQGEEVQISVTYGKHLRNKVLNAMITAHPYEEVAHEITVLENTNQHLGMGMLGEWKDPMPEKEFLSYVKDKMQTDCIRHSKLLGTPIQRVAVLGGSGSFAINAAKRAGAQAFITADLKYHDFYSADNQILLADIGHYESEQFTKELLVSLLSKKISNFAIVLSHVNTNPITYF